MIKNIIFDYGAVLVDWNPHYLYDGYFGSAEKAEWFLQNVCRYEWNTQHDGGKPIAEGTAELVAKFPEWEKEIRMYYGQFSKMVGGQIEGMYELILDLKARGYHVYGLTNWSGETFPLVRDVYPIFSLMEGMVVSGDEKLMKPDAKIFHCLLDRYGLQAQESVFIDDNINNCNGARAVGLSAIQFKGVEDLKAALAGLLQIKFNKMEAILIDINDYEYSGEGANGTSYNHKTDPGIMLKLYNSNQNIEFVKAELDFAQKVFDAGIPTPKPGEFVTDGKGRFGMRFQRIVGKKSFSRAVGDDPQNVEHYAREFARMCKLLHSTKVSKTDFPNVKDYYLKLLEENEFYSPQEKEWTRNFIQNAPDGDTAIHGDLQFSNCLQSDMGNFFIDLGDFAYGHPYFDLGMTILCCLYNAEEFTSSVFHMSNASAKEFWYWFVEEYFGAGADHDKIERELRPYAGLRILMIEKFAHARLDGLHWLIGDQN